MPKEIGSLTLYSVDDLHEKLGLSKMTIRAYLREGKIRARKLGVQWYVTEEALREYFDEPRVDPPAQKSRKKSTGNFRYVVQGINDLVSEKQECETLDETIECIENQAIISLFQVTVVNKETDEVEELIKAREFLDRYRK
ncbi:helix-turn-helix domain-containing protein [Halalkalibaculum sp. DA384]|uniref:helix-turn-helix domain-containing protein n=1 Tax=Halalkalibaculum sp. DA384 TaxID=3373606 RepID=UPI0037542B5E